MAKRCVSSSSSAYVRVRVLDDSFGYALQAGIDVPIDERWSFNAGVWYIDIDTSAQITAKSGGTTLAKVKFDVDIDPWVYNIGIAYRF